MAYRQRGKNRGSFYTQPRGSATAHLCYNRGHRVSDSAATNQLARTQKRLLMVPHQEQPLKTPDTGAAFPLPGVPNDTGNSPAWPGVAADSATMNNDPIVIGQRSGWGSDSPFGIQPEDARHHRQDRFGENNTPAEHDSSTFGKEADSRLLIRTAISPKNYSTTTRPRVPMISFTSIHPTSTSPSP